MIQYEPNDAVFENSEGNFSLRLGRLSTSLQSGKSIIPNQVDIQISLNDTFIRLPKEACQAFESTFKLVFNEKYGLYTVDDNLRSTLKSQNLKFTFTLEDKGSSGKSVDIVVPYNSFDLKTDLPLTPSPMNFFPLLCEGGPSLGRAFLQEAYLAADNDKKAFYVFQAKVPKPKRFAPGKIAAISIGGAVFLGLVVAAVYEFLSRMHRKKRLSSRPTYRFSVHNLRKSQGTFPESPRASNQSTSTRGLSISNIPDFKNSTTRSSPPIYSPSPPSRPASSYYGPPVSIPSVRRGSERSSFHQVSNPVSATSTHPIIIDASQQSPFLYPTSPTSPIDRASVVPLTRQPTIAATRHRSLDSHPEPKVYIPPAYYSPKPGPSGVATRRASEGYYSSPTRTSIHRSRDFGTQRLSSAPGGGSRYSAFTARGPVSPMSPLNPASEVTASPVQEQAEGRSNDPFKIAQEEAQQQPDPAKFKYGRRWSHLSR
ncbi:MAG: hypothetical protein M1814_001330 [Vezdaea aestivalis]|nr:MAG: hypothetical protein M1814_001330 [Vezdaea aestivalis]